MSGQVRIGLKHTGQNVPISELQSIWRTADEGGFDHLWDSDHLASTGPTGPDLGVYEGWALLAAMAVATKKIRIGCMVTANTHRHPAVLAKLATTVDHLSAGRLEFGIGAAWSEIEHGMLGLGGLENRVGRLQESLQVVKALWTLERTTFAGRYYNLTDAIANPKPIQIPHPPVWIGAGGQQMLKIVARHADVWNASDAVGGDKERALAYAAGIDQYCSEIGRNPAELRRSVQVRWDGADPAALIDSCADWSQAGFTEIVIHISSPNAQRTADRLCDQVLPKLSGLRHNAA
jgi:alkanesulfonate monooxygenase SsuD/methylene tetrahydromethanopterin reductase-like flavin-dependent oxidoreductase (luciferase family)